MKSTIGVSTWSLQQLSFTKGATVEDIVSMCADMGAEGIDICEEYIPCHPQPDLVKIRELRRSIEQKHLRIGASWFCTEIMRAIEASSEAHVLEVYKKNIIIAAEMGAEYICIPMLVDRKRSRAECKAQFIHYFEQLIPFAEKYNMPIAHECARQGAPGLSLELAKHFNSRFYGVCPDLEAWRVNTPDLPLTAHAEDPLAGIQQPESIELFRECLPYSPYIHFKLLALDEKGEEPHFPIHEMMRAINDSPIDHYLCIEYEGWIPDLNPTLDSCRETERCVELVKRYRIH
ncbi:MAG: TIM barrel protein [Oscillospiraceae bacterium]